jgi:hypothetical protein
LALVSIAQFKFFTFMYSPKSGGCFELAHGAELLMEASGD